MKKILFTLSFGICISSLWAQQKDNFKKEMIESEEHHEIPIQFKSYPTDFESFKKAKAWNSRTDASSIFTNPTELDISIIGGRVLSILVDKTNNIALVAPAGGGLWKFNPNTNASFTPINDFGSFMAVTSITQDPFNSKHIIVATGDFNHVTIGNGLFESFDGGNTFTQISSTSPSTNLLFNYVRYVKFSPQTQNTIYVATPGKVLKSTDAGITWAEVFSTNFTVRSIEFVNGTGVLVSVVNKGLYKSTTGNANTFTLTNSNISTVISSNSNNSINIASFPNNRNIVYAILDGDVNDGFFKSIDGGTTWQAKTTPVSNISQGDFCLTVGVHPTNSNIVIIGSVGWGYTKDGGNTWYDGMDLEVDFHDVHFHASNPDVAYLGYDQGFGSVNFAKEVLIYGQMQPEQIEIGKKPGFNTMQIYSGDFFPQQFGDSYIEGQQDGGVFAKVNNVEARVIVGDGGSVFVNKQNPNQAFASTQKGNLYKTGSASSPSFGSYTKTGNFYNNHPNWITQFEGNNADATQMYMATNNSIQRTLDFGINFTSIATHNLYPVKVTCENASNPIVYAGGTNANTWNIDIIRISNAKTNPTAQTLTNVLPYTEGQIDHITVDPNDQNTVYIGTTFGMAYKVSSINSTPVVTNIKGNIPKVTFNTIIGIKNRPGLLIAGTNVGLFYSQDGGSTWTLSNEIPFTQITELKFRESDNRLFVFTFGRGAWAMTLTNGQLTASENTTTNNAVHIYPNPVSDQLTIINQIEYPYLVDIFDLQGNKVLSIENNNSIALNNIQSGMYIVHITSENKIIAIEKIEKK